jgi:hypothetical protein
VSGSGDADFDRALQLLADKREDEALDRFELASEHASQRAVRVSASAHIAALLLGFQRPWEVAEFTGRMRRDSGDEALAALLDASACVQLGDAVGALQLTGDSGSVATPFDPWFPCSQPALWSVRIRALHEAGRDRDAIAQLHAALSAAPLAPPLWEATAMLAAAGAFAPDDVLDYLEPGAVAAMFGWIAGAPVEGIDAIAEAIWARRPADRAVLAAATLFAWRLDADAALRWSVRLASTGASARSPVHERAERAGIPPTERVEAAMVAAALDADRSRTALAGAVPLLADDDLLQMLELCAERAPILSDTFVVAAATSTARCLTLASELVRRGHDDAGFAVLVAGLTLPAADHLTRDNFVALVPDRERDTLATVARRRGDTQVAAILASVASGA